jgi:hypothetical protein
MVVFGRFSSCCCPTVAPARPARPLRLRGPGGRGLRRSHRSTLDHATLGSHERGRWGAHRRTHRPQRRGGHGYHRDPGLLGRIDRYTPRLGHLAPDRREIGGGPCSSPPCAAKLALELTRRRGNWDIALVGAVSMQDGASGVREFAGLKVHQQELYLHCNPAHPRRHETILPCGDHSPASSGLVPFGLVVWSDHPVTGDRGGWPPDQSPVAPRRGRRWVCRAARLRSFDPARTFLATSPTGTAHRIARCAPSPPTPCRTS